MKSKKIIMYLLAGCILLAACKGDDGEPGPKGDAGSGAPGDKGDKGDKGDTGVSGFEKLGSIEGTITGARRDGTSINETFKYEYHSIEQIDGFGENGAISFTRFEKETGGADLEMYFKSTAGSIVTAKNLSSFRFEFNKERESNKLFRLSVSPYFHVQTGFKTSITDAVNEIYKFTITISGAIYYTTNASDNTYSFPVSLDDGVYYINYRQDNGALSFVMDSQNVKSTSGEIFDLYNQLKFIYNANADMLTFYTAADNVSLAIIVPDTPADQFTISNYVMNQSTGVITFDFTLKVSGYRSFLNGVNTTQHDITINGKFNSGRKVFTSISGRVGG